MKEAIFELSDDLLEAVRGAADKVEVTRDVIYNGNKCGTLSTGLIVYSSTIAIPYASWTPIQFH